MTAIKPCPFCNEDASIERYGDARRSTIYNCDFCGCFLETGEEFDHGAAWNTRPIEDALQAEIDHLQAHAEKFEALYEEGLAVADDLRAEVYANREVLHAVVMSPDPLTLIEAIRAGMREVEE